MSLLIPPLPNAHHRAHIVVFPLSIFVIPFSNSEKPSSHYPEYILFICSRPEYTESNFRVTNLYHYER